MDPELKVIIGAYAFVVFWIAAASFAWSAKHERCPHCAGTGSVVKDAGKEGVK